jgi:hypothetical protein
MKIILTTEEELSAIVAREVQKCFSELPPQVTPQVKQGNYTSKELQELFNVSAPTIWAWERKGLLHPVIVSRRKTYLKEDIEKLIQQKQIKKRA